MEPLEVAWAAGLFEGEGCFTWATRGPYRYPVAKLQTSDLDVLERFARLFGARVNRAVKTEAHHKQTWYVQFTGEPAIAVGEILLPFLGSRRTSRFEEIVAQHRAWQCERKAGESERRSVAKKKAWETRRKKLFTPGG